jgi:hypothetical protein
MTPARRAALGAEWSEQETPETRARAAASASSWGWLLNGMSLFFAFAALTVVTYPLVLLLPESVQHVLVIEGTRKALPVWSIAFLVPLVVVPRVLVPRAWSRELAWANDLPFDVDGFIGAMGESPTHRSSFRMHIEFVGDAPDAKILHEHLDQGTGTWLLEIAGRDVKIERSPSLVQPGDERNRRLLLWFHELAEQKLRALHAAHPIAFVAFVRH